MYPLVLLYSVTSVVQYLLLLVVYLFLIAVDHNKDSDINEYVYPLLLA